MNTKNFIQASINERDRAIKLFPKSDHVLLALNEEHGELVKAIMDHKYGKGSIEDVRSEAIQVMAMILRLVEEGDPTINLPPIVEKS